MTRDTSQPPVIKLCLCRSCGATCEVGQVKCWLCQADPQAGNPYRVTDTAGATVANERQPDQVAEATAFEAIFVGLLALCFLLALLIGFGLAVEEPGTLVPYAIVVGPAFLIPGVRALWQMGSGERPRASRFLLNMAITFAVTIAIIALLAFAAIALLMLVCFSCLAGR